MGKRFTDTEKYRKPFVRGLSTKMKLLWDFIYHECDYSGVWIVDLELAEFMLIPNDEKEDGGMYVVDDVLKVFNKDEERVIPFADGKKWFIPQFLFIQYGQLRSHVKPHQRVIEKLEHYGLYGLLENGFYNNPTVPPTHIEGYNKEININKKEKEKDEYLKKYWDLFNDLLIYFPFKVQPSSPEQELKWLDCIRKLIELDGHTAEDIKLVVQWGREHEFWQTNFLSLLKLRNKDKNGIYFIDRFKLEMINKNEKNGKRTTDIYGAKKREIADRIINGDGNG